MTSSIVEVEGVSVAFGANVAVRDMSFRVREGEGVAILGRTGAGKSTILNLLVGNLAPSGGRVAIAGVDPYRQHRQLQGKIGMAFQTPRLLPWRNAIQNVEVGLEILKVPRNERRERAREWLARVHLENAAELYPSQLSGGMRQRVSLARAFVARPRLVLLDESFSALDEVTADALRRDFVQLRQSTGTTSIAVTHSIDEAFQIADRVMVFARPAQLVAEYDAAEVRRLDRQSYDDIRAQIHRKLETSEGNLTGGSNES